MTWAFALLIAKLIAGVAVYGAYRRDLHRARASSLAGSRMLDTARGPIEYATLGEGLPVLVLHGTSGGWDQGLFSARGLAAYGFKLIAPSRFGYLRTPLPANASAEAEADTWASFLDALHIGRLPVVAFSAGAAPAVQLALRHPERVSALALIVPGAGGLCSERAVAPPAALLNLLFRFDFLIWAIMRVAPRVMYRLVAVPASLVPSLPPEEKARLDEAIRMILPVSSRRRGVLNEARTQRARRHQYPLERITTPTLLASAADDLYKTLPVARHAASRIPDARLMEFASGGHLMLGRAGELLPRVATFFTPAPAARHTAA